MMVSEFFSIHRRTLFALTGCACFALMIFGLYLQHMAGLEPCPMCIVQRYLLVMTGVFCLVSASSSQSLVSRTFGAFAAMSAGTGAFVAARQSWLQWYPPEVVSCGRDLYGMIENFPLQRVLPMVFKGSGDCSKVDWTFLGGSIANWSFVWFTAVAAGCVIAIFCSPKTDERHRHSQSAVEKE